MKNINQQGAMRMLSIISGWKAYFLFMLLSISCSNTAKRLIKGTYVSKGNASTHNKFIYKFKKNGAFDYIEKIPALKQFQFKGYGNFKRINEEQVVISYIPFEKMNISFVEETNGYLSKDSIYFIPEFINGEYSESYGTDIYFLNINGEAYEIRFPNARSLVEYRKLQNTKIRIYTYSNGDYFSDLLSIKKETNVVKLKIILPQNHLRYITPFGSIARDSDSLKIAEGGFDDFKNVIVNDTLIFKNNKEMYLKNSPNIVFYKNGWFRKRKHGEGF